MNKKRKKLLILLVILVLLIAGALIFLRYFSLQRIFARGTDSEMAVAIPGNIPNSLFFNFENDTGNFDKSLFYKGIAHSGVISAKAFGKNTFSYSISRTGKDVGIKNLTAVALSAWLYVFPDDSPVEASLVFTGANGNISICWNGISLKGEVPRGKWFKISGKFDLASVAFTDESKIQAYLWNNSSTRILMDDLFISFGKPAERMGDTTLLDLTVQPYSERFNYPPFRTKYFQKEESGNEDASYFLGNGQSSQLKFEKDDKIITGDFAGNGITGILVAGKKSSSGTYYFCSKSRKFNKTETVIPSEIIMAEEVFIVRNGKKDLLLAKGNSSFTLLEWINPKDPCNPGNERSHFNTLWSGNFEGMNISDEYASADIDGDRVAEIVGIGKNGSWKIFRFNSGKWTLIASSGPGDQTFARISIDLNLSSGKFLKRYPADLLLAVSKNGFDLLRYDAGSRSFSSCFRGKEGGKVVGLDTLRPGDQFLCGDFERNGNVKVFRYNRDWRYDLKEISFNDSTYQIMNTMDFSGYSQDHNPKYSEILKLYPGNFLGQGTFSMLCLQRNPNSGLFPDVIGIYKYNK
ncbi:MAG: hypothetical protein ACM3N9_03175 [Syntrophothermus sp.]